jgi:tetratricopeptide (TPR) repeat protein
VTEVHEPSDQARSRRDRGLSLYDQGKFEEARGEFEAATDIDLNFAEGYGWLSAAQLKLGLHEEAMRNVDHALWLDPFYAWGWNRKGLVFFEMGDFSGALTCFRKALECEPGFAPAKENLKRTEPLASVNAALIDVDTEKREMYRMGAPPAKKKALR